MAPPTCDGNQAMLPYHSVNYIKPARVKEALEDIGNNNNNNDKNNNSEARMLGEAITIKHYSSNSRGVLAQCLVTGAVLILAAGAGMPIGYSAVLLPQLSVANGTMYVDAELGSWIASVHSLATPVGSLLSGSLLDTLGRRGSLQLSAIPLCLGWIFMGFANNITYILVGRVVCGFAVGLIALPAQVLVSEMADPGLRGFLTGGSFSAYCFGILLIYAFGASFSWDVVAFCGTVLPVVAIIALLLVPESPAWLVRRRKIGKARKAILWLRGGDMEQANHEIAVLESRINADNAKNIMSSSFKERISSTASMIRDSSVMKPVTIINIFTLLQLTSGTYVIVFYAVDLMQDIGGDSVDKYLAAVVTAVIRCIFSFLSCYLLLKTGRRFLGILSALGTALASLILAGYMLAKAEESVIDKYVLGICLLVYVGANTLGLLVLPSLMTSELLPQRARGIYGGFNFFVANMLVFAVTKVFPMINNAVGIAGVFAIFGASAVLDAIFIYIAVPETKNRTLQQIEDYFQQKNILWITRAKERRKSGTLIELDA
ncbi:hypothetical protein KM043_016302 [Ampulex compressa]|nr:hypothetical protein KM043_016302 [Ampulex compressa]